MSDDLRDAYASIYKKPQQVDEDMGIISIPATLAAIGTAAKLGGACATKGGCYCRKAGGAALATGQQNGKVGAAAGKVGTAVKSGLGFTKASGTALKTGTSTAT